MDDSHAIARWRLVLGADAEGQNIHVEQDEQCQRIEELVGFLFGESDDDTDASPKRSGKQRSGSRGRGHAMNVPDWVDSVSELFSRQAKEVMERELVRRRGIADLLESPKLMERIEPNFEIVKTLLTHRDLLNEKTRSLARKIISQVVEELKKKMRVQIEQSITGAIRRDKHSPRPVFRNLDLKTTLRRNLKNYDSDSGKLLVDQLFFYAAERRKRPWHIIIAVDQSGSMLDSAIFSAVMASIFAELPAVTTSLFLFDTEIADLSDQVGQPVDVLLSIQLGGGTNICKAVQYSQQLVREPSRTIVVLITDFFEGGPEQELVDQVRVMNDSGVRMIGLGALGYDARPAYNKTTARKCRKAGMDILVCTPEKLADCMAQIIRA